MFLKIVVRSKGMVCVECGVLVKGDNFSNSRFVNCVCLYFYKFCSVINF